MTDREPCPSCGEPMPAAAEFCPSCRLFVDWDRAAPRLDRAGPDRAGAELPLTWPAPDAGPKSQAPDLAGRRCTTAQLLWDDPVSHRRLPAAAPTAGPAARSGADLLSRTPDRSCRQCGTVNDGDRRFCGKCGERLLRSTAPVPMARPEDPDQLTWWRRWWRTTDLTTPAARRVFRRSLPGRYRARRVVLSLLVVAVLVGVSFALVNNPVAWAKARWADLTDTLVQIGDLQASVDPSTAALAGYPAAAAVDGHSDTAWGAAWTAKTQPVVGCLSAAASPGRGAPGSLRLFLPAPTTVRAVVVYAGLAVDDSRRLHQWLPRTVRLSFSDGTCQQVGLRETAEAQKIALTTPTLTDEVTLSVVDSYPSSSDSIDNTVTFSEVEILARPR